MLMIGDKPNLFKYEMQFKGSCFDWCSAQFYCYTSILSLQWIIKQL